jgi:hypothetical protein
MKIEAIPASPLQSQLGMNDGEDTPLNDNQLIEWMMAEWRATVLSSDGLTEEDNIEW